MLKDFEAEQTEALDKFAQDIEMQMKTLDEKEDKAHEEDEAEETRVPKEKEVLVRLKIVIGRAATET